MRDESKLLAAVRRGDERAVRKLVEAYSPWLYKDKRAPGVARKKGEK